jgi:hypothetical protein
MANAGGWCRTLLDSAVETASSDAASLQIYDEDAGGLRLAGWRGFHPASAAFWQLVVPASASTCGMALVTGDRVVVPDVDAESALAGSDDLDEYRRSQLRAVQSTPLMAADGRVVGMVSTHWRTPHESSSAELRRIDVLARECAAAVEHDHERELRALAIVRAQYRTGVANRHIGEAVARLDAPFRELTGTSGTATFMCACGRTKCRNRTVTVSLEVYERVCFSPHRFLISPGHGSVVDDVVERGDGYEIVEIKTPYRHARPPTA